MKKNLIIILFLMNSLLYSQKDEPNYFEIKEYYKQILSVQDSNLKTANNKWLHRWLWNSRFDFNTDGKLRFDESMNQFDNKFASEKKKNNLLSKNSWIPLGPIQIPPTYVPRSCYSMGRINCIAFHPVDSNIFWIGTPGGGIWKTIDYGKNWLPLGDNFPSMAFSHIAVNPKDPDILYAATGDFDISGMTSGNTVGVIKSSDGGNTWEITKLLNEPTFSSSALRKIIIHPQNTDELLVAGRKGIWKSSDAGETWKRVCDSIITDLEINPKNPSIIFAAMGQLYNGGSAGILKSSDFGETWEVLSTGIPAKGEISRMEIAIAPSYPDYIYALAVKTSSNSFHSFWGSTDGGLTWTKNSSLDSTNNILGAWGGDLSDNYGQGSYDLALIVDPNDKNKVYTGGINIWMSDDMGRNWKMASFWIYVFGESIHADHHWADYNPIDKKFYWCNDGGVYRTKSIKPGDQNWVVNWIDKYEENLLPGAPNYKFPTLWENLNDGLAITEFYRMSLSKNNNYVLAGGSQDNSCYYYNTGNWLNYIPNYDGMETMIHHDNPDIFYGVWQNGGLCKTEDGGKTIRTRLSQSINERGNWITPTAMNPEDANHIYMGYRNLWQSLDGGENWSKALDFDLIDSTSKNRNSLSIVKQSYSSSKHLSVYKNATYFQDTSKAWIRVPGELWITNDGGISWMKSRNGLPIDSLEIVSVEYDRQNPSKMWAAINTWIREINTFMTTDGGETWKDISQKLPAGIRINSLIHQTNSVNTLYAGTNKGVYYCDDSTLEWKAFNENLPLTIVNDLEIQESTGEIFAATYGRGIWQTNLRPDNVQEVSSLGKIEISPNPVKDKMSLTLNEISNNLSDRIEIQIIDITGTEVFKTNLEFSDSISLEIKLQTGVYFIILRIDENEYSGKFIKL